MTNDTDVSKGLAELFEARPQLLPAVKDLIEQCHYYLHNRGGRDDTCIPIWGDRVAEILEAARKNSSLQAWAKSLDDFEKSEQERVLAST